MRVLSIIGTRPEALKMGPVIRVLATTRGVESLVCATGQHRELLSNALALFNVKPDFSVTLRRRGPEPDALLAALLARLGPLEWGGRDADSHAGKNIFPLWNYENRT